MNMATSTTLVAPAAAEGNTVAPLESDQILKATKALLAHMKKTASESVAPTKHSLLDDEDPDAELAETPIWLNIVTKRHIVSKPHLRPSKVYLPHPLNRKETATICLITADPQRAYKDLVADEQFPAELRKRVSRVIGFAKLKAKFSQYEAQRALYAAHDVFLADDRIVNRLPTILGKTFFKNTTKRPVPVVLSPPAAKKGAKAAQVQLKKKSKKTEAEQAESIGSPDKVAKEIERALGAALVSLSPSPQVSVKVGTADMSAEDLAENVDALARAVVDKHVPHKWKNVKGVFVKGPQTAALPIWQTDALWVEDKDVLPRSRKSAAGLIEGGDVNNNNNNNNNNNKRKTQEGDDGDAGAVETSPPSKRVRKGTAEGAAKTVSDSNDAQLDRQIAERRSKLKQQKQAARQAVEA